METRDRESARFRHRPGMRRQMASGSPGLPSGPALPRLSLATMRWAAAHLAGQLSLALPQVDDMPEQTIRGPLDVTNLYDHLRAHPMDPAKHQRRTETATAWGRDRERHLVRRHGLK